jgi:hypothetical protein
MTIYGGVGGCCTTTEYPKDFTQTSLSSAQQLGQQLGPLPTHTLHMLGVKEMVILHEG